MRRTLAVLSMVAFAFVAITAISFAPLPAAAVALQQATLDTGIADGFVDVLASADLIGGPTSSWWKLG